MRKRGGNAVDAAVAVGLALAVTHPVAGNLGGGGFMLVRMADGRAVAIDYRETAPAGATPTMYLDKAGNVLPNASILGARAVGVPGTVAGLALALQTYGTLPWRTVVEPARLLAADGFRVGAGLAYALHHGDSLSHFAESRRSAQEKSCSMASAPNATSRVASAQRSPPWSLRVCSKVATSPISVPLPAGGGGPSIGAASGTSPASR